MVSLSTEWFLIYKKQSWIKNGLFSDILIAKVASVGIFGLSLIIWIANSLIDSTIALNSTFLSGRSFSEPLDLASNTVLLE